MTTPVTTPATDWRGIRITFVVFFIVALLWATFRPFVNTSGTNLVQMAGLAIFAVVVVVLSRRSNLGWWAVPLVFAVPLVGWAVKSLHFSLTQGLGTHRMLTSLLLVGLAAAAVGLIWVGRKTRSRWEPALSRFKARGVRLWERYEKLPGIVRWLVVPMLVAMLGHFLFGAFLPAAMLVAFALAAAISASRNQAPEISRRAAAPATPLSKTAAIPFDDEL